MLCVKCQTEIPATSRFCPSCGAQNAADTDTKSPQEVTLAWLETVYKEMGYKESNIKNDSLYIKHDAKPNLSIQLKAENRFIGVNSWWNLGKPANLLQRGDFIEAVNKANSQSFMINFSRVPGKFNELSTSSFMWIRSKISARDVADFTDMYANQVNHLFDSSGLSAFA
jgi:zinc-ribbon domain